MERVVVVVTGSGLLLFTAWNYCRAHCSPGVGSLVPYRHCLDAASFVEVDAQVSSRTDVAGAMVGYLVHVPVRPRHQHPIFVRPTEGVAGRYHVAQ